MGAEEVPRSSRFNGSPSILHEKIHFLAAVELVLRAEGFLGLRGFSCDGRARVEDCTNAGESHTGSCTLPGTRLNPTVGPANGAAGPRRIRYGIETLSRGDQVDLEY